MKSHTSFRLIPTLMTLNDLERRNSPYFAFLTKFDSIAGNYVTVVEERSIIHAKYCLFVSEFQSSTFGQN